MKALIIAEHNHQQLAATTASAVTAAAQLTPTIDIAVIGHQCVSAVEEAQQLTSVQQVLVVDQPEYQNFLPENTAVAIAQLAEHYDCLIAPATTFGKDLLPRVAALLNTEMLSDVTAIQDNETFVRPIYAGNALATVRYTATKKLFTIRPTAFEPVANKTDGQAPVEHITITEPNSLSQLIDKQTIASERPELTKAKIVVAAGRGIQNEQNRALIEQLADHLGAAVGATRAAVDAGLFPNDYQIGQTGKKIAPELYIGIALSGSPQHIAGIRDSKTIVAINKDPNAPIFQIADYALVGNLEEVVPEMINNFHNQNA